MDIHTFINSIIPGVKAEEILHCSYMEDLNKNRKYKIVELQNLFEHIPVFELKQAWDKILNVLGTASIIVLKTSLYESPNELDKDEQFFNQIRCNKQTSGTLMRECLRQQLLLIDSNEDCFAFIRKVDLTYFHDEEQKRFLAHHHQWLSSSGLLDKNVYSEEDYRQLVPGAGRMLIGCVAENNKKYQTQALRLVQSIRWFGGKTAGADIFVCIVDSADTWFVEELQKWSVYVRIVNRFNAMHPPSNKLRFFELPEATAYDTVMLLDCDTIMVQDPYPFIDGEHFQAEIAAGATVTHQIFKNLFAHYHLPLPSPQYITSVSKERTIWYCNAGVLIFPNKVLKTFYPIWKNYTMDLSQRKHLLGNRYFFCEQASLSIAFAAHPVPFKRLPIQMNYHLTSTSLYRRPNCDPIIIHYHHLNDQSGFIKSARQNLFVMRRVNLFNQRLKNQSL